MLLLLHDTVVTCYCCYMLQLLLIDKKLGDVHTILLSARVQVEQLVSSNPTQKESLRVFFLILQVCHYLMAGQVRKTRAVLRLVWRFDGIVQKHIHKRLT